MSKDDDMIGALYFFDDVPHIIGHFRIKGVEYQVAGVRKSPIKADITLRQPPSKPTKQIDLFGDDHGRSD
jgi:hypothetical protein